MLTIALYWSVSSWGAIIVQLFLIRFLFLPRPSLHLLNASKINGSASLGSSSWMNNNVNQWGLLSSMQCMSNKSRLLTWPLYQYNPIVWALSLCRQMYLTNTKTLVLIVCTNTFFRHALLVVLELGWENKRICEDPLWGMTASVELNLDWGEEAWIIAAALYPLCTLYITLILISRRRSKQ